MKNYNEMANDVLRRVSEHNEKQNEKRKAVKRIGSVAACFCIAAIVGFAVLHAEAVPPSPSQSTESETHTRSTNAYTHNSNNEVANFGYPCLPDNQIPDRSGVIMISSYGNGSYGQNNTIPKNGSVCFSPALQGAIDEYGDSVLYRIFIDVYSNGQLLETNSPQVDEERERLVKNDYIVAYETYFDGTENHYYFTIHAKLNELTEFKPDNSYGYMLSLYEERVVIDH